MQRASNSDVLRIEAASSEEEEASITSRGEVSET